MNSFEFSSTGQASSMHTMKSGKPRALILAMNPSIDLEWQVPKVVWEEKNIIESERRWAGGKGINVSRWLHRFGSHYRLLAPLGGEIGRELRRLLKEEGIHFRAIPISQSNRVDVIVTTETGRQMRFNPRGPLLSAVEMESLFQQIDKELSHVACLVLSGSLPRGAAPDTYGRLIQLAAQRRVPALLDCDGEALRQAVTARPFLVKPNHHELARWARKDELASDAQVLAAARAMASETGHWVFVSRGAQRSWLVHHAEGTAFYAEPPSIQPVNTVGAGDALLAAVASQILRGASPEEWLRWGIGVGAAATELPAGRLPEAEAIEKRVQQVKLGERKV